nr:hypothetical protein CFP56_38945 [Quercus suber]
MRRHGGDPQTETCVTRKLSPCSNPSKLRDTNRGCRAYQTDYNRWLSQPQSVGEKVEVVGRSDVKDGEKDIGRLQCEVRQAYGREGSAGGSISSCICKRARKVVVRRLISSRSASSAANHIAASTNLASTSPSPSSSPFHVSPVTNGLHRPPDRARANGPVQHRSFGVIFQTFLVHPMRDRPP